MDSKLLSIMKSSFTESALLLFREKIANEIPESRLCVLTQTIWENKLAITAEAFFEPIASGLWKNRGKLVASAEACGYTGFLFILLEGEHYAAPLELNAIRGVKMILPQQNGTSVDLALRVLDSNKSCAIVDVVTNRLRLVSDHIHLTSGRDVFWMEQNTDMNGMWNPSALDSLNRDLRQQGSLTDFVYEAYSWEFDIEEGLWVRKSHTFHAEKFELTTFRGRLARVSLGVSIVG